MKKTPKWTLIALNASACTTILRLYRFCQVTGPNGGDKRIAFSCVEQICWTTKPSKKRGDIFTCLDPIWKKSSTKYKPHVTWQLFLAKEISLNFRNCLYINKQHQNVQTVPIQEFNQYSIQFFLSSIAIFPCASQGDLSVVLKWNSPYQNNSSSHAPITFMPSFIYYQLNGSICATIWDSKKLRTI